MSRRAPVTIGWREWVRLPELSPLGVKAKIDTGARTSALHAFRLRVVERESGPVARFEMHPMQRSKVGATRVELPIEEFRSVRSSDGRAERRPVVVTPIQIGSTVFDIELTLASRDAMGFRMLLGRAAVRRRYIVDPGRSFLVALPPEDPLP